MLSIVTVTVSAYANDYKVKCAGEREWENKKDVIEFNLEVSVPKGDEDELFSYERKFYHYDYSTTTPTLEFQDTMDISYWQRNISDNTLVVYDFMDGDKANILIKIDLSNYKGLYQSHIMDYSLPLKCSKVL